MRCDQVGVCAAAPPGETPNAASAAANGSAASGVRLTKGPTFRRMDDSFM